MADTSRWDTNLYVPSRDSEIRWSTESSDDPSPSHTSSSPEWGTPPPGT